LYNKGESFVSWGRKSWILSSGGELGFARICSGELGFMQGELFVSLDFVLCFALLPMVSSPFASP
jgi:hypothetical protein